MKRAFRVSSPCLPTNENCATRNGLIRVGDARGGVAAVEVQPDRQGFAATTGESSLPAASGVELSPGRKHRFRRQNPLLPRHRKIPRRFKPIGAKTLWWPGSVACLREWEAQDDSESRPRRLQELDALLNGTNTIDLFEIVQELPPNLMGFAFALPSLQQRMMADPKAAADWMSAHTNISETQTLTLVHHWGQKDREEMRQYLAGLPEGQWKQAALAAASNDALSGDPVEAITWARQMDPGEQQTSFLQMAAQEWAKRDPEAVVQWMGQVNDPALREQLAGALAVGYAALDPAQAAGWLIQSVPPGEVLNRSLGEIAWTWAMREPAAAGAWVLRFPEGPARQMALGNLMGVWGNRDRASALDWIEGLPGGSLQTEAALDLLETIPTAEQSAQ